MNIAYEIIGQIPEMNLVEDQLDQIMDQYLYEPNSDLRTVLARQISCAAQHFYGIFDLSATTNQLIDSIKSMDQQLAY